jgi:hypothetical protein
MDFRRILVRFEGRIGRGRYWLASLIILASMISALALLAGICLGLGIPTGPLNINVIGISASFQLDDDDVAVKAGLFPHIANIHVDLRVVLCRRLDQAASRPQQERLVDGPVHRCHGPL